MLKHTSIILLSNSIFNKVLGSPLGQSMWLAHVENGIMPVILEVKQKDSSAKQAMKRLIFHMTQYSPEDRPSMDDVELQLTAIEGETSVIYVFVDL